MRKLQHKRTQKNIQKPPKNKQKYRTYLNQKQERILRIFLRDVHAQKPFHHANQKNIITFLLP